MNVNKGKVKAHHAPTKRENQRVNLAKSHAMILMQTLPVHSVILLQRKEVVESRE